MFFSLSSFVRRQLEQSFERIPPKETGELRIVENWERGQRRELGATETARLVLHHAIMEVTDRSAEYRAAAARAARVQDPLVLELVAVARAELISALDWVDQCTLEYRNQLRKEAERSRSTQGDQPCLSR